MDLLNDINARFEPAIDADTEASQRRQRLAQQVAAVRRRSRRIRTLRTLLPAAIIAIGVVNIGWIIVTTIVGSLNVYNTNGTEIRMTNPHFSGLNGQGSPYTVTGLEAVKKAGDSVIITLKAPAIDFRGNSDKSTHISGANGVYDGQAKTFHLMGNVVMTSGDSDMTFRTEEATVNLVDLTMSGDKHIEGTGSMGHIVGESFVISKNGSDVVFKGRGDTKVWATLNRDHPKAGH